VEEVSALRRAEDRAFCRAVGLRPSELGLPEAPLRGCPPFADSLRNSVRGAIELGGAIRDALLAAGKDLPAGGRPWLMCPAGIGDHVDHLVVLRIVLRSLDALRSMFRVGFYEDLHYAADGRAWKAGVARLQEWIAPARPRRSAHRIDDVEAKLGLIGLYRSQLGPGPISIGEYTPGHAYTRGPHEAFWSLEPSNPP
jgi:hypothetical protein